MPSYIGYGFITSFHFLWDIGEKININKYNVTNENEKKRIIEFLKKEYNLEKLYILHKKDSHEIAIFNNIIEVANPYCVLKLPKEKNIQEHFKEMKNNVEPKREIEIIVY